jgi:STE24 endopeptidase
VANEDKAARYHRLQRRASLAGAALGVAFLLALLLSGASAALRDLALSLVGGATLATLALYVGLLLLTYEVLQLPLSFYQGVTLERRYGLSRQTTAKWWADQAKAAAVGLCLSLVAAAIAWSALRWDPERWWVAAAVLIVLLLIVLAQLAPALLLPIFYDFKPLDRPALSERLLRLADRARTPVLGVFEWRLGDRTRKANAALAGIGRTRRILLSDTLLAEHSDEEIEVIVAHEIAHHVHRDIWSALALEAGLILAGFYAADVVLTAFAGRFGLTGKDDIAALPLLALALGGVSLVMMPLANAFSRAHERRADRYALGLTRNAAAFVSAMKRLAVQNLAEEQPSRLVEVLFHSHPSTSARIAVARAWASRHGGATMPPDPRWER